VTTNSKNEYLTTKESEFVKVIKDNEGIIYKIARMYTKGSDNMNDLYQDIVYQLWKYFDTFKGESKRSTWIYRVSLNTAITQWRKEKRKGQKVDIEHLFLQKEDDYDDEFENRLKLVYAHIKKLDPVEKGLMLLLLEGKKYAEIAEITGFSASNVGTRISRIKKKLKEQIIKDHDHDTR
jgi:RNA polymerase sigma-70 factor (ECF subfamily)